MNKQRTLFFVFGLVAGLILGAAAMAIYTNSYNKQAQNNDQPTSGQIIVEGKLVCLPHKNTDGPQTLECASGLQTTDGKYYAVEGSLGEFASGRDELVRISGTLKANATDKYQSEGVIVLSIIEAAE